MDKDEYMAVAAYIKALMDDPASSAIRRMFEDGSVLKKQYGEKNVFDFSLGNPNLPPPAAVLDAVAKVASENPAGIHGYMPNAGFAQTRAAVAAKVSGEQGCVIGADNVIMTCGAASALNCVLKAALSAGDEVVVPAPYFPEYRHYAANHGGVLIPVPCTADFSPDTEAISAALTEKTAALLLNSPNNPTGRVYSADQIRSLAGILTEHGRKCGRYPYLICDEPYRAVVCGGTEVPAVFPLYPHTIVVSSFAKDLSIAGERIGYIAVNPACPDASEMTAACVFALRILGFVNAPAFFQRVIAECGLVQADAAAYEKRGRLLMSRLDEAGISYVRPDGAFYLFCRVPDGGRGKCRDDAAFCGHLKSHRVLCAPGSGFGYAGWFRMSYCVSEQTIERCGSALLEAVRTWKLCQSGS